MPRNLPPLAALRAFEAAARHLSFKSASEELRVTPAAISQQIKTLEDYTGVKLFRRLTRALALTEAGKQAAPEVSAAFDQLEDAYVIMRSGGRAGPLTVSLPPSLASKWLVPRLGRFHERHPEIDLRIDANTRLVQFDKEAIDMAIRFGMGSYPGLKGEPLFQTRTLPVCSPKLTKGRNALKHPADLKNHTLIHLQETGAAAMEDTWAMWLRAAGIDDVDPTRGPRFNTYSLLIDAALAGHGVALVEYVFADEELTSGKLVQPFADVPILNANLGYHVVYPPHHADDPRLQAFRVWLFEERDRTLNITVPGR
ncbi:MAG: transcriptional regulator GcvA [Alphaproteobacteria bacterium]|nr:transcriptional regulator GcvA [Alphaproteobacteria bacterium]MBO6865189.1 transcriptional regulator GcvA [Alphaproteobacteria bacterium]